MLLEGVKRRCLGGYGVSQNYGYHFGGSCNKDYSILESVFGSPYFGKPPYVGFGKRYMGYNSKGGFKNKMGICGV